MVKVKVLILTIFTFLFLIACGGDSSINQNTSSSQVSEESNPPTSEDNNTSGSEGDESGNAEGTKPTPPISEDNTSGSKNDDGENTEGNQPTPPINEGDNSSSKGDESDNTEGNQPTPPISEDTSEDASSDAEELPQEPQVEVKYTSVGEKSNDVATVTCEEVYELDTEKNIKYSLFADFYGDYIAGSSLICSLNLNEGYEKSKLSNVKWTISGTYVYDNPKYSETIFLHWTDKKVNPPVERCMDKISRFIGGHKIDVSFKYDSATYSITYNTKMLSKLEGRKFEHLPEPPQQNIQEEESIPTFVDDPLDCSKSRGLYDGGMLNIGKAPSTTQNGGANLPLIGYNYRGTNPFEADKTYAFIRIIGDSTKADYICKQQFNKEYACPRDFRFQICNRTESECYFTFRSDYMMKDTNYNLFHSNATGSCRVQIPLTDSINYAEDTGFQYDGGKKMNFPFYVGDPSLTLNSSNSINFVSISVDNLDGKFSLLGGLPNFARGSNITFNIKNTSNKGDNNIALFTITWKTYNKKYEYNITFDGWAKLPEDLIF